MKKALAHMSDVELVAELWRKRVEWLWSMCEATPGTKLDLEWLDEQITKDGK